MKSLLVLFGLLALVIGCSAPAAPTSQPPSLPPPTVILVPSTTVPPIVPTDPASQPTESTKTELGETVTYHDDVGGFEIKFPLAWNANLPSEEAKRNSTMYAVTIYSYAPEQALGEGIPEGESKMDILVIKNGAQSVQEALDLRKQEFANGDLDQKIVSEEMTTLASGLPAAHLIVTSRFGESSEVLTTLNGSTILLGGVGDYALLDAIAQTLRPIES